MLCSQQESCHYAAVMISHRPRLDHIANALPINVKLRAYHVSTPPTSCEALFSAPPGQPEERTFCESHFFGLALPPIAGIRDNLLVYAIEVLIFTTAQLTTIFVSKADSTGFLFLHGHAPGKTSIIRTVSTAFLKHLVEARLSDSSVVLSLFARSQNQYLFPGSIENASKHVLDDRQLVKWWCRTLDPIVRRDIIRPAPLSSLREPCAYLIVPGCDKHETRVFFPASARGDSPDRPKWVNSYPVDFLVKDISAPPRCLLPRFPDDPKARFLVDLDDEKVDETGHWRSIKTLSHFWEMMSYRQECSAGRLVGFIWAIFPKAQKESPGEGDDATAASTSPPQLAPISAAPQESREPQTETVVQHNKSTSVPGEVTTTAASNWELLSPAQSPLRPALAEDQPVAPLNLPSTDFYDAASLIPVRWPDDGRGELIIDAVKYQALMDYLLQIDFAGEKTAIASTHGWIKKAEGLAGVASWGSDLNGRSEGAADGSATTGLNPSEGHVNVLTGIRKKRKVEGGGESPKKQESSEHPITNLASNLIRKKPKV